MALSALPAVECPLTETLGELLPLDWLLPFLPLEGVGALLLPLRLQGRIPLRQFCGRAQADNTGVLTAWRF